MRIDKFKVQELMAQKQISTQTELASHLGITKNQLSVMLSTKYSPIKSNVLKLCEVFDVLPSVIFETETEYVHLMDGDFSEISAMPMSGIKTIELFAGAGGLALGMEYAGLESVALIEIDKNACDSLRHNRPDWNVVNEDVRNIDFTQFQTDVIVGGFPCQAFSYAGKKMGFEDTRGTLFFEFARAVKEIEPKMFLAENVRGIINHDNGRTLSTILSVLSELGYDVKYKLVNAVNYGVPQKRERVLIVGTRTDLKLTFHFPREYRRIVTLREALKNVPQSEGMKYSEKRREILKLVPPGGCWRNLPVELQKSFMGKSYYSGGGRTGMARRMSWDEPSLTLTTSPSQKQTERCHPEEIRPFTVREYARIQTFPDWWEFKGSLGEQYKQIGNAVPVKLAYRVGQQIIACLNAKEILDINSVLDEEVTDSVEQLVMNI